MADQHTSGAPARVPGPTEAEDPLAADRRTLTIGAIATVALILVGVVSAQLFARGGCGAVATPQRVAATADTAAPADVVDEHLGDVDGGRVVDHVETVAGAPVVAAVPVGEAVEVAVLGDGFATTGATVTSLDATASPVATYETGRRVVGDGPALYDVTVANDATGQVDAFVPLSTTELEVGACVDTALVGSPFAFLLDAGDGQLLLFRADEEGEGPLLELRDAEAGVRWEARLTLPGGSPGRLAERLTARLGPEAVVAARRVGPQEETDTPALVAVSREDGAVRFELPGDTLAEAADLDPAQPIRWHVAAVGRDTALVHGRPDPSDAEDADVPPVGSLVLLDLADGTVIAALPGVGPLAAAAADRTEAEATDRYAVATEGRDEDAEAIVLLDADGTSTPLGAPVSDASFAWVGDEVVVAAVDSLSRVASEDASLAGDTVEGARFLDVTIADDGRLAVLVTSGAAGGDAVLLVTDPTDGVAAGG